MAKKTENTKMLKIMLVKSPISSISKHKKTVEALGLKKIGSAVTQKDNAAIRGMLFTIKHMIVVEEI